MTMRLFFFFFSFTFLMLHRYTKQSALTMRSTLFRRRLVEHEATELSSVLLEADGEGAIDVVVSLSSDKKQAKFRNI